MRKLSIKYPPVKFECPYCNRPTLEMVDVTRAEREGYFRGRNGPTSSLQCFCGAEFRWAPPGRDQPAGVAKECAVTPVKDAPAFEGWRLVAVKGPLVVRTYTLKTRRRGAEYAWPHKLIRIPANFKLIADGPYIAYHARDGSIILKPLREE